MNMLNVEYDYSTKLCFHAQWYCDEAALVKRFFLSYFPYDGSVELYDADCKRVYMRRSASESLPLQDFFAGNTVFMYGRQIEIGDCLNEFTRNIISITKQHTFLLIKPSMANKIGFVINEVQNNGYTIFKMRMAMLTRLEALTFYSSKIGDVFLPFEIEHIISGRVVGMEIVGYNAVQGWLDLMGPDDPVEAKLSHPQSLRARFGESKAVNGFHVAADHDTAKKEAEFFFHNAANNRPLPPTTVQKDTACCIIKPHVTRDGNLGNLIASIEEHPLFKITALKMMYLTKADCEVFLEVYSGTMVRFHNQVGGYVTGPAVAIEVACKYKGINVHAEFRKFVGPVSPVIAKQTRPHSLRALYGSRRLENALHVTVLAGDIALETEYLFKIID